MSKSLTNIAPRLNSPVGITNLPRLLLVTDETRLADPSPHIRKLPAGSGVIFRHYNYPNRIGLAREISSICRERGLCFIVSEDASLAFEVNAGGLHLPEHKTLSPSNGIISWIKSKRGISTCSCHSKRVLHLAGKLGVSGALVSPVFPTLSHPTSGGLGLKTLASLCRSSPIPVFALGGIDHSSVNSVLNCGVYGLAGIGAFLKPGV